jgi:hypothetical protein
MAERRAIKSTIWDDTWFGRLSPFEMVIWIGLFSKCADDQGRLQNDPALIRSKLFPFRDVMIKDISQSIVTFNSHLMPYTKGEPLIQIVRWWENQPMQYATPSNYPPPDGWKDRYRTNYKGKHIVFNWNGQENTQAGILLWQGLSILDKQSSWTTYLGTLILNPILNPTLTLNPLNNTQEGPGCMQKLVEQMTGYTALPNDLPAIDEMERIGVVKEDIAGALAYFKSHGKTARGAQNLLASVKFQVAQRVQAAAIADVKNGNGSGPRKDPVGHLGEDGLWHREASNES